MSQKIIHQDQKYVEGLKQNNSFVIQSIYEKFAPKVINYIKQNSGDEDQAKDVIQETIMTIYNQAHEKNLQLTCPFDAYFFLLCKRRWLNNLKKSDTKGVTINEALLSDGDDALELVFETRLNEQQHELFEDMFQKLGQACKDLLKASFKIKSMQEVAESIGVTYAYARKKKSLCIGQLTKMVQASPKYQHVKP
ncbi:RNA polymerase sigma factor [Gelidibacter maritimus]|uniref:Sigma-70 family RNA polymerase sigma factor n=1 Tax=Gelidibacter maritimus TaxID=2761487 RepID=A0A7W2M391_9FLAO|nr:sigma-70 family RNA polymerase sigma factor [Gelidibacter maritimus]MBA6151686.1 sigma-70 family RNA polymerase sigma factor [Gelidibacter maritimus]